MPYAELGRRRIQINIKSQMIGFWLSIVNVKESNTSKPLNTIIIKEQENGFVGF